MQCLYYVVDDVVVVVVVSEDIVVGVRVVVTAGVYVGACDRCDITSDVVVVSVGVDGVVFVIYVAIVVDCCWLAHVLLCILVL